MAKAGKKTSKQPKKKVAVKAAKGSKPATRASAKPARKGRGAVATKMAGKGKTAAAAQTARQGRSAAAAKTAAKPPGRGKTAAKAKTITKRQAVADPKASRGAAPKTKSAGSAARQSSAISKAGSRSTTGAPKRGAGVKARSTAAKPTGMPAAPSVPMPAVGDPAPDFTLQTDDGRQLALADFAGRPLVLYFYPKADTPGCTREACSFQADLGTFQAQAASVVGVSPDQPSALARFRQKYHLDFLLASDAGAEVAQHYGVWVEKNMYGRRYMGIQRATFLIGKDGRIAAVWPKVSVEGHSQEVQAALQSLS